MYNPGSGSRPANSINNNVFFILFALIATGMVLSSIWFFFIHPRGGFHWKETDWDDYKSTVLRRKGPDGKTLSNATKSTKLGGGSVMPKFHDRYTNVSASTYGGDPEMGQTMHGPRDGHRSSRTPDHELHAYRHEKPARVGGLNSNHDGSHYDYTQSNRSELSSEPSKLDPKAAKKAQKEREKREKQERKQEAKDQKKLKKDATKTPNATSLLKPTPAAQAQRGPPSAAYSFTNGDDASTIYTASVAPPRNNQVPSQANSYYSSYRPHPQTNNSHPGPTLRAVREESVSHRSSPSHTHRQSPSQSRQGSPKKQHRESRYADDESSFAASTADTGTKSYPCHIPGLSKGEVGVHDSISQVGSNPARRSGPPSSGFRRGRNEFA
jgi:hypothetical protein